MRKLACLVAALVGWAFSGTGAGAVTFGFGCITNNLAGDCAIGEAQLTVDVTAGPGANQVTFTFSNSGPSASSITDAYFDNGTLLGIAGIVDADQGIGGDPGVDFSQGASPGNLPGGNNVSPAFVATAGFTADSDPPTQPNGVNPGEELQIIFDLMGGGTLADVLAELGTGELRIGIHVQGYGSGGSESFVNVPEPGTLALVGLGLAALAGAARRRGA